MKKLEKYLREFTKECEEAATTESKYFKYKGCTIRLSKHFNARCNAAFNIVKAANSSNYIVTVNHSAQALVMDHKEVISLVEHFFLLLDINKEIVKAQIAKDNRVENAPIAERTSQKHWPAITQRLCKDTEFKRLGMGKKKIIKDLFREDWTYSEMVFAIRNVVDGNSMAIPDESFKIKLLAQLKGLRV